MNNTQGKELREKLLINNKNAGLLADDATIKEAFRFAEKYKVYLNVAKTERKAVKETIALAQQIGFTEFDPAKKYNPGDKVYYNNRGKSLILSVIGTESMEKGVHIIAAHIDSPRLDLKPRPLYEDAQVALFKTHYYGGIKKYQWAALPLSLHGVIVKEDGSSVEVNIGDDENDPVLCVTDLLPHLAEEQMKRKANEIIKGEELNIVIGLTPFRDEEVSERVKLNIIKILNEKYGIVEHDLLSAELEAVPAIKAKDVGLDRSMIGSYGQDDRVCAYTAMEAIFNCDNPKTTAICVLADKEEVGSDGNTGLKSAFMRYFIADLAAPYGIEARRVLSNSQCLSADVNVAFDPTFPEVTEKRNTAYLNYGVSVTKYTGARGKSGTSDASAEFMGTIRSLLNKHNIIWQTGELGKVDQGGGGTVAAYLANLNIDVIDVGVPVLSMHSPFELTSKLDVYMAFRTFHCFFND